MIDPKLTTSNLLYDYFISLGEGLIEGMKPLTKGMIVTKDPKLSTRRNLLYDFFMSLEWNTRHARKFKPTDIILA